MDIIALEWTGVVIGLLGILLIMFIFLYSMEKADREKFEKLMRAYKKAANEAMNKWDILIDLSDSLNEDNVDLREYNDELCDAIDECEKKIEEKEKRIEQLEKDNDKLCEQIRRIFHDRPATEG